MTAEEHIIAWIESSQPHYKKLLQISVPGNFLSDLGRASDHDASSIIGAALAISKWELEQ